MGFDVAAYRSVLDLATALAGVLERDAAASAYVARQLCEAVDAIDSRESVASRQGFAAPDRASPVTVELLDDSLAVAASDLHLALVMFTASDAVGEQQVPVAPALLRAAVAAATSNVEQLTEEAATMRFGSESALAPSPNMESAAERFRDQSTLVLQLVADECEKTLATVVDTLREQAGKVLDILGSVGELVAGVSPLPPLLRRAWQRLLSAMTRLEEMVRVLPVGELRKLVEPLLAGTPVRAAVDLVLGTTAARAQVSRVRIAPPLLVADVDRAAEAVVLLGFRFGRIASSSRTILGLFTLCAGAIAAQVTGPVGPLVVPAVYGLVVASVLLAALDFIDAGSKYGVVRGVLEIGCELEARASAQGCL